MGQALSCAVEHIFISEFFHQGTREKRERETNKIAVQSKSNMGEGWPQATNEDGGLLANPVKRGAG